jgi:hypothetical protein
MAYQATINDWLALLGIEQQVRGVFQGEYTVGETLTLLLEVRQHWPNTGQDYVAVIDAVGAQVEGLRDAIAEQHRVLLEIDHQVRQMRAQLPDGSPIFDPIPIPDDRLLNEDERARMDRLPEEIDEMKGIAESYAQYREDQARDYEINEENEDDRIVDNEDEE